MNNTWVGVLTTIEKVLEMKAIILYGLGFREICTQKGGIWRVKKFKSKTRLLNFLCLT
jgi:hypothetical protein